jgi:hypothetical protein
MVQHGDEAHGDRWQNTFRLILLFFRRVGIPKSKLSFVPFEKVYFSQSALHQPSVRIKNRQRERLVAALKRRASRITLKGVSAARRKWVKPACANRLASRDSPAWAPNTSGPPSDYPGYDEPARGGTPGEHSVLLPKISEPQYLVGTDNKTIPAVVPEKFRPVRLS